MTYRESPAGEVAFRAVGDGAFDGGIAARVKDDGAPLSVEIGAAITRADIAGFLLEQTTDTRFHRAAPAISN